MLSKRQKQVLDFIKSYKLKNEVSPSLEEIKAHLDLSAVSTAHYHVKKLIAGGYVQKDAYKPRTVAPHVASKAVDVKVSGYISAGHPIEYIDNPNDCVTVAIKDNQLESIYALRVIGNNMADEGLYDNDVILIRKQDYAYNGQTVVVLIDRKNALIKKFYREKDRIRLESPNIEIPPIYKKEVEIQGVVVKIVRNLEVPRISAKTSNDKYEVTLDDSWEHMVKDPNFTSHVYHSYPATVIPQVARRLIQNYSREGETVCDISCGSGTVLVESMVLGRNSYGIDPNLFAIFLAKEKVKRTNIDSEELIHRQVQIVDYFQKIRGDEVVKPNFTNIENFFKESVIEDLTYLKTAIEKFTKDDERQFFMVMFSEVVWQSSNVKIENNKLVKIPSSNLSEHNPNIAELFRRTSMRSTLGLSSFNARAKTKAWSRPILRNLVSDTNISPQSIDCVVTALSYDRQESLLCQQLSELSAQWVALQYEPYLYQSKNNKHDLNSDYLNDTIDVISRKDSKSADNIERYFIDLEEYVVQAHKLLKLNKYLCVVVDNSLVNKIVVPTDYIIAELAENIGFGVEEIIVRNMSLDQLTSTDNTVLRKSLVILKKLK